jgi:mannose-6-phosphate isomerase-like protein (cupin superfamily)
MKPKIVVRPWGSFIILYKGKDSALKMHCMKPNSAMSLQSHKLRAETWHLVEGQLTVQLGNKKHKLSIGKSISIKKGQKHRAIAGKKGALIIELCRGKFRENDIVRYEDRYGRV